MRKCLALIRRVHVPVAASAALIWCIVLAGCASGEKEANRNGSLRTVSIEEFKKPAPAKPHVRPVEQAPATTRGNDAASSEEPARADNARTAQAPPVAAPVSAPASASGANVAQPQRALKPGEQIYVDGLLGQVSGRPIFIDALLEPLADQLRSEAARMSQRDFVLASRTIVERHLQGVLLNELVLAEAEANLTQQQQQGLLNWIRYVQERTISMGQGVRGITERQLQQEEGMTLEQFLEYRKNRFLIDKLLMEKIEPRVIVSWRDVQREYDRRKAEFSPPASVTLKRIVLSNATAAERIEQVKQRLAAGEEFNAVWQWVGPPAAGSIDPMVMGPGGVSDIEINDDYKPYLQGLTQGQTTKAIEQDGRTIWFHVASIDTAQVQSLYDVQRQLLNELTARRMAEQRDRYIRTLLEKSLAGQFEDMAQRLHVVAVLRYGK